MAVWALWLVSLTLSLLGVQGFVLKRSAYERNTNRLADALDVIQRERRRIRNDPYDMDAIDPYDEGYSDLQDEMIRQILRNAEYSLESEEEEDSRPSSRFSYYDVDPKREEPLYIHRPSKGELQDIFSSDEDSEEKITVDKKMVPYALGGPPIPHKKSIETENSDEEEEDSATEQSVEESSEEEDDEEETEDGREMVGQQELESVFSDESEDEDEEESASQEEEDDESESAAPSPYSVEQYEPVKRWNLGPTFGGSSTTVKRKRSGDNSNDEEEDDDEDSIDDKDIQREYIKALFELEDDENTKLAHALNLATMAQVERSDQLIPEEIRYLRQAIEDEEALQELKNIILADEEDEEESSEEPQLLRKRQDPVFVSSEEDEDEDASEELAAEEAVEEAVEEAEEEAEEEEERERLLNKFRNYLGRTSLTEGRAPPVDRWYDDSLEDSESSEEVQLNPFLRNLWQKYQQEVDDEEVTEEVEDENLENSLRHYLSELAPWQRNALKNEVAKELAKLEDECPVMRLVDNCALARDMGLALDDEALDLCNRHSVCYQCGSFHGMTRESCDHGFIREAEYLCRGDEGCKDDAAGLYLIMLSTHRFIPEHKIEPVCMDTCNMDYVYGIGDRRK